MAGHGSDKDANRAGGHGQDNAISRGEPVMDGTSLGYRPIDRATIQNVMDTLYMEGKLHEEHGVPLNRMILKHHNGMVQLIGWAKSGPNYSVPSSPIEAAIFSGANVPFEIIERI